MHPLFRQGVQGDNDCMKCNVTGKKIILFATSGGSRFGKTVENLKGSCPGAEIVEGKILNGRPSVRELKEWTEKLDLN